MSKLFLSLDDAVLVASKHFHIDEEIARSEFEQKCYISNNQYQIGYADATIEAIRAIEQNYNQQKEGKAEGDESQFT